MTGCVQIEKGMLTRPIEVRVTDRDLEFSDARRIADEKAKEAAEDPMLLSWYDRKAGRFSPNVECCGEDKPAWLIYAESRGANITVDINDEEYVFVYLG